MGRWVVQTEGEITPAAAGTAKTFLSAISGASIPLQVKEVGVGFIGTVATSKPALVELCQSTQATAGTSSAATPRDENASTTNTATFTAAKNYTVEPTALTPIREWLIHPGGMQFVIQFPLGERPIAAVSKGLAIRVTFATGETVYPGRCYMVVED
jgi:hypothetical protein